MKQVVIVAEDRPGTMEEISEALEAAGVNIETLSAHTVGGTGVMVMTVDRYDAALQALARTRFRAVSEEAFVVQIDDQPGELARLAHRFSEANLKLRTVRIIRRSGGTILAALASEHNEEAKELVKDVLVK